MSAFAQAMLQISIESGEVPAPEGEYDHSGVGAEEIPVVTDQTQTELEEAVQETADVVDKMLEHDAAAEKIVEATDSLESKLAQLRVERENGRPLAGFAVSLYNQSLAEAFEAREIPAGVFESIVVGLQESFESNQLEDYTSEAEAATESLITKLWNMLKTTAAKVWAYIEEFFKTIGKSGSSIKAGGTQIKRLAGALDGEVKTAEISGKYARLHVGGSFSPTKAVEEVTSGYESVALATFNELNGIVKPWINSFSSVQRPVSAESIGKLSGKAHTLPGGYTAQLKAGAGEGGAAIAGAKFTITAPAKKDATEKVAPLTKSELNSLGGALEALGARLVESKKAGTIVSAAHKKLIDDAGKKINDLLKKENKDGAKAASGVVKEVNKALEAGKTIIPAYLGFAADVGKEAYNFGKKSLGAYGKKVEAGAADATGGVAAA